MKRFLSAAALAAITWPVLSVAQQSTLRPDQKAASSPCCTGTIPRRGRSSCSPTSTWWKPSAPTGRAIRSGSTKRTANGVHGLNERIRVTSLYNGRDFLYGIVKMHAMQK